MIVEGAKRGSLGGLSPAFLMKLNRERKREDIGCSSALLCVCWSTGDSPDVEEMLSLVLV